ncbi:MAG: ATP-binding protein [Deltaproteobacteria bacterium]|nr:ATP-binding protein [Deltaproteobacteria bacterium]
MFYNRAKELHDLDSLWQSSKAQLVVVYGRRRVGKSVLLKAWIKNKPGFYWTATATTSERLLQSFSKALYVFKNPKAKTPQDFSYPNWESALVEVALLSQKEKVIVVIDEFPYLIEANAEISSLLQKIWDSHFENSKALLTLTGSRVGMIEKHVLSSRGPLYGRATSILWLDPLPFGELHHFLPRYSKTQLVEVYSITGGVPLYVKIFDDSISVLANIQRELSSTTSLLKGEPYFLIHEELKEPMRYVAILEALGMGKRQLSQIAATTGIEKPHLIPYLKTLETLRYVKRNISITENKNLSRKGLYDFSDLFLKFYFRFIAPCQTLLEEGREKVVLKAIEDQFDAFVGKEGFEALCQKWLTEQASQNALPFTPDIIGKYWDTVVEVDVAALSHKQQAVIIGESKWTNEKCGLSVLQALNKKADHIIKKFGFHVNKFIFSKSGFATPLIERARIENVRLVNIKELFK